MFAMLTGNLPFTVEPFTIRALHNKMVKGEMNSVPDHLTKSELQFTRHFVEMVFKILFAT
jgi:hormonally upregulated Neu-associated kinase